MNKILFSIGVSITTFLSSFAFSAGEFFPVNSSHSEDLENCAEKVSHLYSAVGFRMDHSIQVLQEAYKTHQISEVQIMQILDLVPNTMSFERANHHVTRLSDFIEPDRALNVFNYFWGHTMGYDVDKPNVRKFIKRPSGAPLARFFSFESAYFTLSYVSRTQLADKSHALELCSGKISHELVDDSSKSKVTVTYSPKVEVESLVRDLTKWEIYFHDYRSNEDSPLHKTANFQDLIDEANATLSLLK